MPIYEYTCDACGKEFEALVSSSRAKTACPACGAGKLTRRFSTFAAHGASTNPCESGACPSMAGGDGGSCASGKCPYA